jgi:beta-glucanase (GH16 family)
MPSSKAIRATTAVVLSVLLAAAVVEIAHAHGGTFPEHRSSNRAGPSPSGIPGSWKLVLNSEFDGRQLPADWHTGWFGSGVTPPVNRGGERDCYSPKNVTFPGDGTMHLNVTAQRSSCDGVTRRYTGAMVTTDLKSGGGKPGFEYTYGVLQARVYIPADGARIADWPAVWADGQNWPTDGEDDVVEGLDGAACFHFDDPLGRMGGCDHSLTPGWHTFASDWRPGSVTYYYDGALVGAVSAGVTSAPMYVALDNTVSTHGANVTAADSLRVQYVRVWQRG